jgi:hypothetical protein
MQQQQRLLQGQQAAAVAAMQQHTVQQQYQQPFMQYQSLAAASLPAIPLPPPAPAQQAPSWLMPSPVPGLFQPHSQPGLLPATPDQQPEQHGSYGFCESAILSRQTSQALSGYSEAASGSMALPQYQLPQCMMPGGEAVLRFSGPAASRSSAMGGDAVQRQAGHAKAMLAEAAASQSALAGVLSQKQRVSKCSSRSQQAAFRRIGCWVALEAAEERCPPSVCSSKRSNSSCQCQTAAKALVLSAACLCMIDFNHSLHRSRQW